MEDFFEDESLEDHGKTTSCLKSSKLVLFPAITWIRLDLGRLEPSERIFLKILYPQIMDQSYPLVLRLILKYMR